MGRIRLDAVAVTARDMARSVAFYEALGVVFEAHGPGDAHVEGRTEAGGVRLMIDSAALAAELIGAPARPANHAHFAMLCDSPGAVDRTVAALAETGAEVIAPPWDAVWGQRYATVADPDGYRVDLFAPLPPVS